MEILAAIGGVVLAVLIVRMVDNWVFMLTSYRHLKKRKHG
jgi:hypothetical protein